MAKLINSFWYVCIDVTLNMLPIFHKYIISKEINKTFAEYFLHNAFRQIFFQFN